MDHEERTRIIRKKETTSPNTPAAQHDREGKTKKTHTRKDDYSESDGTQDTEALPTPGTKPSSPAQGTGQDDGKTKLHRSWDPVTAWLVITDGPGIGKSVEIKSGINFLGRGTDQTICVNFGDDGISRDGHISITYDPYSRKFFISPGTSRNPAYLNGIPVLQAYEILSYSEIRIGKTVFCFVPFCGKHFDWDAPDETPGGAPAEPPKKASKKAAKKKAKKKASGDAST